jgi:hypothetical protein
VIVHLYEYKRADAIVSVVTSFLLLLLSSLLSSSAFNIGTGT